MADAGMDMDVTMITPASQLDAFATTEAASSEQQNADPDKFKVCLNREFMENNLSGSQVEELQREFADWYPGPVLLPPGTEVRLSPAKDKELQGRMATVVAHRSQDPRIVTVSVSRQDVRQGIEPCEEDDLGDGDRNLLHSYAFTHHSVIESLCRRCKSIRASPTVL